MNNFSLFNDAQEVSIRNGCILLKHFASVLDKELILNIENIKTQAPLRNMKTKTEKLIAVGMTNCGEYGWVSDHLGYRYSNIDLLTNKPWPVMPVVFKDLAKAAALKAGYMSFTPDSCLINEYLPGIKMGLHQDKDESDLNSPIVSVSLGINADFQFGTINKLDKPKKIILEHGDVIVWGGKARLAYHGVLPIKSCWHPELGAKRINLTFRKAF